MQINITLDLGRIPDAIAGSITRRRVKLAALATLTLTPLVVYAVSKPHTFTDGSTISASQVNANFDTVYDEVSAQGASVTNLLEELMPSTCPSDMKLGGKAGTESAFCIEANERSATTYHNAVVACANLGRHVCTQNQWWIGTTISGVNAMCGGNWEWVGDRDDAHTSGHLQVIMGGNGCTIQSWAWAGQHANGNGNQPYRCCKGGISSMFD